LNHFHPAREEERDEFLFVGNQLGLDFLNTRPVLDGEPHELLPDFAALLRWFQAAGLLQRKKTNELLRQWEKSERSERVLASLIGFRERLRNAVLAWEETGTVPNSMITELNRLLGQHPMLMKLSSDGSSLLANLWFEAHEPEDLFAPVVHSVATLFANADQSRVRKCGQCVLHFLDTSKKGTRRWCSMQLCGNRVKVAAYAQRRRGKISIR
jgi:predicted RNA-binding Zn ribbon-like protein